MFEWQHLIVPRAAASRSISAENPTGAKATGAQALPTDPDSHPAARTLGKGWKVRPCLRDIRPGTSALLAEIEGPGIIRHVWCTVDPVSLPGLRLRVTYNNATAPAIDAPLGHLFANGLDGLALVNSLPVTVNPRAGMNWYWPMPFLRSVRIELVNDAATTVKEFFYQIDYTLEPVEKHARYLHAAHADSFSPGGLHTIADIRGGGAYMGAYFAWEQRHPGWWGEGEVKVFIDGDPPGAPTICGTGVEDYACGAFCFAMDLEKHQTPTTYNTPFAGYPQHLPAPIGVGHIARHGLYRWHIPDPIYFERELRITVQALGWNDDGTYRPLADHIRTTAFWYADHGS